MPVLPAFGICKFKYADILINARHFCYLVGIYLLVNFEHVNADWAVALVNSLHIVKQVYHRIISLSCHEQVCLMRLRFERCFSHHHANQMIMLHIFIANMRTWKETIKLADLGEKLHNATN